MRVPARSPKPPGRPHPGLLPGREGLWWRLVAGSGALVGSLAVGLLPSTWSVPVIAGCVLLIAGLIAPAVPVMLLGLGAVLGGLGEFRVGGSAITGTDGIVIVALAVHFGAIALGRRTLGTPKFLLPIGLFLGFAILSTGWVVSAAPALKELVRWFELAAVAYLAAFWCRTHRDARWFLLIIFVGALVESGLGIYQAFARIGPPSFSAGALFRAHGTFGQPNPFAGYLGMVLPLAVTVVLLARGGVGDSAKFPGSRLLRITASLTVIAGAIAMALSLSRGAWIGAAAAGCVIVVGLGSRTLPLVGAAAIVTVLVATLGAFDVLPVWVVERLSTVTQNFGVFDARRVVPNAENWGIVERMAHWQAAWEMFEDRPWLGVGIGQYVPMYPDYAIPPWSDPLGHAHNIYLNMLAELGAIGAAFYGLMVASWFALVIGARRIAVSPLHRATALGIVAALAATAVHGFFDNLHVGGMNVHLGVLIGIGASDWVRSGRVVD